MSRGLFSFLVFLCGSIGAGSDVLAQLYYNQRPEFLKANSQWAFGRRSGLDFNTANPDAYCTGMVLSYEGVASVADPVTGALLFYTNGVQCWNRNHQLMPVFAGGNFFNGNVVYSTTQGACIVPVSGSPSKYYVFTLIGVIDRLHLFPNPFTGHLYYSVVDMSLDNGLGDIVPGQMNILLDTEMLHEGMIAIPGNCGDVWLMVHHAELAQFRAYHITAEGINPNPVTSVTGTQIQGTATVTLPIIGTRVMPAYLGGGMAVSPDRQRIAIANTGFAYDYPFNGVLLCKFDPHTGVVSDAIIVDSALASYCPAFSPDNSRLYLSHPIPDPNNALRPIVNLHQYTITNYDSAAIASSKVVIGSVNNYNNSANSYLKLYDGKIYINPQSGDTTLSVIHQPDMPGLACNYQTGAVSVIPAYCPAGSSGYTPQTYLTLPNEVVYPYSNDTIYASFDTTICLFSSDIFEPYQISVPGGFDSYLWDDGSSDTIRTIDRPGTYWVWRINRPCEAMADTYIVRRADIPEFSLGEDQVLCSDGITLEADIAADRFLWSDGSTGNAIHVIHSGTYWVTVSNAAVCSVSDTVTVTLVQPNPQDLGEDFSICRGDALHELKANVSSGASVLWSNGSREASVMPDTAGIWWVSVTNPPCIQTDTLYITEEVCACFFEVPTAFTPNGDGRNDVFRAVIEPGCPVAGYTLNVYNRYGQRVFGSNDPLTGWDGWYRGSPADVGTYFYEILFEGGTHRRQYYRKGDMVLMR